MYSGRSCTGALPNPSFDPRLHLSSTRESIQPCPQVRLVTFTDATILSDLPGHWKPETGNSKLAPKTGNSTLPSGVIKGRESRAPHSPS